MHSKGGRHTVRLLSRAENGKENPSNGSVQLAGICRDRCSGTGGFKYTIIPYGTQYSFRAGDQASGPHFGRILIRKSSKSAFGRPEGRF